MFGSVDELFYNMLAGIRIEEKIEIAPYFTDEINYYSETHDYANIIEKSEKDENRMA